MTPLDPDHLEDAAVPRRDAEPQLEEHGGLAGDVEADHEGDGKGQEGEAAVLRGWWVLVG